MKNNVFVLVYLAQVTLVVSTEGMDVAAVRQ